MSNHQDCRANCGATDCTAPKTTLTTGAGHGMQPGDWVTFTVRDTRWWRRLLFKVLRRGEPCRTIYRQVTQVSNTTVSL